jgi:predicted PurR-regulated permease PerM
MKTEYFFNLLILGLFILSFYLLYRILSPYLYSLAWAVIFTIVFFPLYTRLNKLFRHRRGLAAITMTILVIIVIILPSGFLLNLLANELIDVYHYFDNYIREGKHLTFFEGLKKWAIFQRLWDVLNRYLDLSQIDFGTLVLSQLKRLSLYAANQTSTFVKGLTSVIFQFFLMAVAIFYLFRDGEVIMEKIKTLIPFSSRQKKNILTRMADMIQATIYGGIVVALIQGGLGGLSFLVLGLPSPIFWGAVMALLSFLPVVGPFLVWFPACVILFAQGYLLKAIVLCIWGATVVSLSDNFLRPILISGRTQVHTLLLFFGVLGGLKVFGFLGFIMGPLVITICLGMLDIYIAAIADKKGD